MPKSEIDAIDRRIVAVLQREGRLPNQELAARVGLSPSPCLRRVARLEEMGLIRGYRAVIDAEQLGLGLHAFVRVQLREGTAEAVARFAASVKEWEEVVAAYSLTGDMDYLLEVHVADLKHYSDLIMHRLIAVSGVADVSSSFVLSDIKGERVLPTEIRPLDPPARAKGARRAKR
jgi:Lrp/AsnC family leucine-responsive transcriptional regulator